MKRVIIDLGVYNPKGNNSEKKFDEISITSPNENNRNLFNSVYIIHLKHI
jgi:hypothetical protein